MGWCCLERRTLNIEAGARIQRSRECAGLTQDALAGRVGLEPKSVSAIGRGVVGVSLETLKNICQALHLSSDVLLFGTGGGNDARGVAQMLGRLTPGQFAIVESVLVKLLEAFEAGQKQATAGWHSHVRPRRRIARTPFGLWHGYIPHAGGAGLSGTAKHRPGKQSSRFPARSSTVWAGSGIPCPVFYFLISKQ